MRTIQDNLSVVVSVTIRIKTFFLSNLTLFYTLFHGPLGLHWMNEGALGTDSKGRGGCAVTRTAFSCGPDSVHSPRSRPPWNVFIEQPELFTEGCSAFRISTHGHQDTPGTNLNKSCFWHTDTYSLNNKHFTTQCFHWETSLCETLAINSGKYNNSHYIR